MPPDGEAAGGRWADAVDCLSLLAVDPAGLGGVSVRAQAGPVRAAWLAMLPGVFGTIARMPAGIGDAALLGGLDLAATLQGGRPVHGRGLLARAAGGVVVALMAERLPGGMAARVAAAMDAGADFGVVALDEGIEADEAPAPALLDRLAFRLEFSGVSHRDVTGFAPDAVAVAAGRARLGNVVLGAEVLEALCGAALALGVESARGALLAMRAARAAAALDGRMTVSVEDAALAARLVLAPRATRLPAAEDTAAEEAGAEEAGAEEAGAEEAGAEEAGDEKDRAPEAEAGEDEAETRDAGPTADLLLKAALAAIPAGLLARLQARDFRGKAAGQGQGAKQKVAQRGRPAGVRAAAPGAGLRLNVIETLRAAAPWQRVRAAEGGATGRVALRREDFRVTRMEQLGRTTTIFVVDASGSSALNRLAEAKGAVELLLADCYRRRDQVAVVAFRGRGAQVLLPPTRSLVRAKRSLAELPGGGGTPLAAGIDAGFVVADAVRRGGATPLLVVLTDGRANVTRAGTGGRGAAGEEAVAAGRRVRAAGFSALVLDTSPRPGAEAEALAAAMGGMYVPLPYANAAAVSGAVRAMGRA